MRLSTGGDPELWQMRQILQGLEADAQPGQRWEIAGLTERQANSSEMLKGGAYRGQAPPPPYTTTDQPRSLTLGAMPLRCPCSNP